MLKTPLVEEHEKLGARMVDFAGWWMPVQYIGLREEHDSVRQNVGIFDVSHMGEIRFKGSKALSTLQWLTTNDVSLLNANEAQYNLLPNERGGLVDDIIIYCLEKNADYLVCVNASNKDKDFAWMQKNNLGADIVDESNKWAQIAVQGPKALELCERIFSWDLQKTKAFTMKRGEYENHEVILATTGYTGERGCEIFIEAPGATKLWRKLLAMGQDLKIMPAGLGARDALRTEMKYPLYGHEIDDMTNPYEAMLGWVVKPVAKDFIGKAKILGDQAAGLRKKLIGFKMQEKGIPRQGYLLFSFDNKEIGKVTSGTHSPTLNEPIGIAYCETEYCSEGSEFYVEIRGRKVKARVCKTPFITK